MKSESTGEKGQPFLRFLSRNKKSLFVFFALFTFLVVSSSYFFEVKACDLPLATNQGQHFRLLFGSRCRFSTKDVDVFRTAFEKTEWVFSFDQPTKPTTTFFEKCQMSPTLQWMGHTFNTTYQWLICYNALIRPFTPKKILKRVLGSIAQFLYNGKLTRWFWF